MNAPARLPQMGRDAFFRWSEGQEGRYEFDGSQPVAMGNVTVNHGLITNNIHRALYERLKGTPCRALGPEVGLSTVGNTVRNPDAMVTCSKLVGAGYTATDAIVVFEVLSPSSGRMDRITKVREYGAVPSIKRYIIVEGTSSGLMVLSRAEPGEAFMTTVLTGEDTLHLPEIAADIPVSAFYEDVDFEE